jgi:hypothetical protein
MQTGFMIEDGTGAERVGELAEKAQVAFDYG